MDKGGKMNKSKTNSFAEEKKMCEIRNGVVFFLNVSLAMALKVMAEYVIKRIFTNVKILKKPFP